MWGACASVEQSADRACRRYAVAELEAALDRPAGPRRGRLLRRRQHDDAGRVDLLPRPRSGRPQVLHHRRPAPVRRAPAAVPAAGQPSTAATCRRPGRRRSPSSRAGRSTSCGQLSEEIFDELMAERIWSGTHALARLHLDAGQRVWLVTAAPVELGAVIAERLGLTGAIGTVAEIRGRRLHRPAGRRPDARPGEGGRDHRPRRARRASIWPGAPPTATRSTTCPCSPRSAGRSRSTPTRRCAGPPANAAGRSATSAPAARRPRSRCRPRSVPAWSPARSRPRSR